MTETLLIALGAIVGANLRYWLSNVFARRYGVAFPWGTLAINVSGSFVIGVLLAALTGAAAPDPALRLLLATGFCGGYTTFSTFTYETVRLIHDGEYRRAGANAAASFAVALLAAALGIAVGGWLA